MLHFWQPVRRSTEKFMDTRSQLAAWLNDAHAMERALERVLENHIRDSADYPILQARLQQHLLETRQHAERVRGCLEKIGERVSPTKSILGQASGRLQAVATGLSGDQIVKNMLMDSASEHFEAACYRSLITAAEELNYPEIAATCRDIQYEDEAMANWLD